MNEVIEIFIGSLLVAFSGALVPGPMLTLVVTSVAEKGFWTSFFIVVGHSLLELVIVILFFLGVLNYLDNPIIEKIIGIAGGAFLLYMGGNLIYSVIKGKFKVDFKKTIAKKSLNTRSSLAITGKGVLISLANPYWYIWWVTIGAAFLIKSVRFDTIGLTSFYLGHISADFIWYLFIGFLISTGRRFFNQKVYNGIIIACSLFLLYLGVKFIVDFIR